VAGPLWLDVGLAALMCGSAGYHAARLGRGSGPASQVEWDVGHLAMSAVMAAMLVHGLGAGVSLLLAAAFVPFGCYFLARAAQAVAERDLTAATPALRDGLAGWAMVLMLAADAGALTPTGASAGAVALGHHGGAAAATAPALTGVDAPVLAGHAVALALALALVLLLTTLWQPQRPQRPSWRSGCQLATSGTMVYMLAVMA
jgi:hypothetical protein